jgi:hypothetical protein
MIFNHYRQHAMRVWLSENTKGGKPYSLKHISKLSGVNYASLYRFRQGKQSLPYPVAQAVYDAMQSLGYVESDSLIKN